MNELEEAELLLDIMLQNSHCTCVDEGLYPAECETCQTLKRQADFQRTLMIQVCKDIRCDGGSIKK